MYPHWRVTGLCLHNEMDKICQQSHATAATKWGIMQTHRNAQTTRVATGVATIQGEKKLMGHPVGMESMH